MIAGEDLIIGKLWKILQGAIGCLEGGRQAGHVEEHGRKPVCVYVCVFESEF